MNKYHILFKNKLDDLMSSGLNVEAHSIEEALHIFRISYPEKKILAIYTPELMELLNY